MKRDYATCMSCKYYGYWYEWLVNWFRERFSKNRAYLRNRVMTCRLRGHMYRSMTKSCRHYVFYKAGRK